MPFVDLSAPAIKATAITTSDTVNLPAGVRGIYVGGAGNVNVVFWDNSTSVFTAPPVGTVLPVQAKRVNAASTTATLLLALY